MSIKKRQGWLVTATLFLLIGCKTPASVTGQGSLDELITLPEVERIERVLAADDMQGRGVGTPGIDKASAFIAGEFRKAGLEPLAGGSYRQEFVMLKPKQKEVNYTAAGVVSDAKNVLVITSKEELEVNERSGYELRMIRAGNNAMHLFNEASAMNAEQKNLLVLVDTSFSKNFSRLRFLKNEMFQSPFSKIFVLGSALPSTFTIKASHQFDEMRLANVVGILPGKSKKTEQVIFSAHYDHIGIGKPENGDSIYNGANDDAAGTTAVIMLARYFKAQNNNERTIVFAAFTAEESGGFGSQYFSKQFPPDRVMAMFNIEMIGTESKWGKNSAFITGYEKTNMGEILNKDLQGTGFSFYPDPYPQHQLFYRSDNATLAKLGVPAHTISTSKMDVEPHYHKVTDQVETLDLANMTQVIKAIALSARSIVEGMETPTRVKKEDLR